MRKSCCHEVRETRLCDRAVAEGHAPVRLALNKGSSDESAWYCMRYTGRGVVKFYESGTGLAQELELLVSNLKWAVEGQFHVDMSAPIVQHLMNGLEIVCSWKVCPSTTGRSWWSVSLSELGCDGRRWAVQRPLLRAFLG